MKWCKPKPPAYTPAFSFVAAAEASLYKAAEQFRTLKQSERAPIQAWTHTAGTIVNKILFNLSCLNKSLGAATFNDNAVDWYTEMVVEYKVPYNHPRLIAVLFT